MNTQTEVGKWNEDLFERFRRAKGERRRALKSELIRQNLPLIKVLTGQVAGIADEKTPSRRRNASRKRVVGADECEWDDLLQMGMEAFAHALEKFDPAKGKIAGYARWWILTKVQRFERKEHMIATPEGKHALRPPVELVAEEQEIDRLAGADDEDGPGPEQRYTIADLHAWERAGRWPEGLARVRERYLQEFGPKRVYSVPRPALETFLARLTVVASGRHAPAWKLWNAWRLESLDEGREDLTRGEFVSHLAARGYPERRARFGERGESERAFLGLRMV